MIAQMEDILTKGLGRRLLPNGPYICYTPVLSTDPRYANRVLGQGRSDETIDEQGAQTDA